MQCAEGQKLMRSTFESKAVQKATVGGHQKVVARCLLVVGCWHFAVLPAALVELSELENL